MLIWTCIECGCCQMTDFEAPKPKCPSCGGAMKVKQKKPSLVHGKLANRVLDLGLALLVDSQRGDNDENKKRG